jgi:hypothetical protein
MDAVSWLPPVFVFRIGIIHRMSLHEVGDTHSILPSKAFTDQVLLDLGANLSFPFVITFQIVTINGSNSLFQRRLAQNQAKATVRIVKGNLGSGHTDQTSRIGSRT